MEKCSNFKLSENSSFSNFDTDFNQTENTTEEPYDKYSFINLIKNSGKEKIITDGKQKDNSDSKEVNTSKNVNKANRKLFKKNRAKKRRRDKRRNIKVGKNTNNPSHTKGCKIMYTNADSLLNKRDELLTRIDLQKPDIIAITETKSKNSKDTNPLFDIPNFDKFENSNPKRGVAIFINNSYNARSVDILNQNTYEEGIWCSFNSKENLKILIGCLYRSPNSDNGNNNCLNDLLKSKELSKYNKVCIMGDFNYPKLKWDGTDLINLEDDIESKEEKFIESLRDAFLIQNVKNPTRNREHQKANILDLILTSDDELISEIEHRDPLGKSDHQVLTFDMMINSEDDVTTYRHKFNLPKGNYNTMRKEVSNFDWNQLSELDVNEMWTDFSYKIKESMDKNIPKVKISNKRKQQPTWMSKKALKKIKKKHKLFKRFLNTNSGIAYKKYITMRNKCKKEIKRSKKRHEKKIADECKNNPKMFWKYVQEQNKTKQGIGALKDKDGNLKTTDKEKADILNDYFASVYTTDGKDIPNLDECSKSNGFSITNIRTTPEEIEKRLKSLDPNKAQGPDNIPPRVLKELSQEISTPLSTIFNKSLESGKLPDDWKTAIVTAIHKKGSKNEAGNYRPVSLTCILCKVLESIIRDAIVEHFTEHKLYAECQHGFRNKRSCISQLLEVIEDLTVHFDGESVDIVYLDFRKAFDTVPHQRLLVKLKSYGITGELYRWVEDFLIGRTQKVKVGNIVSETSEVTSGIPQGSILGPILFTIFINDLPEGLKNICKIFADDTKVYGNSKESDSIQEDIDKLQEWSIKWNLYFNVEKCKVMHIGNNNPETKYTMKKGDNLENIITCEDEKDLGVTFDKKLNFNKHIESAIGKANRMLGLIKRTFSYMDKDIFLRLYKSMVRPHLEYGNIIWNRLLKKHSISIERVQRRATKLLKQCNQLSYSERLNYLDLHSLKGRRLRGDLIETYKMFNGFTDTDPYNFFEKAKLDTTRNSDKKIYNKHWRIKKVKNVYSYRVAPHWNKLTHDIKNAPSTNNFKNSLDGHVFWAKEFKKFDE